jgi:antitoxin HicB
MTDLPHTNRYANGETWLREAVAEAQAAVAKRRVARQLAELMKKKKLTKDALAKRMKTSRAALDRLLDPANPSVTLATLGKAACALKRTLRVELS